MEQSKNCSVGELELFHGWVPQVGESVNGKHPLVVLFCLHVFLSITEASRGHKSPWIWSYRRLGAIMWELELDDWESS